MGRIIMYLFALLGWLSGYAQKKDIFIIDNWINYNRLRGPGDNYGVKYEEKPYYTADGDTLIRRVFLTAEFDQVQKEESLLHGKRNGLAITYYPNGIVAEINYYLNDKLWNVISRADSNGTLLNPGTLHNGTGIRFFFDLRGNEPNCYETYVNGFAEGPYYWVKDETTAIKGNLTYKKSLVKRLPGKKVTFINSAGVRSTIVVDTSLFRQVFLDEGSDFKVLTATNDSVEEAPKEYKYIELMFDDPAIVPYGTWQIINFKTQRLKLAVTFDSYGNPVKVIRYKEDGSEASGQSLPSYNTRKW